MMKSRKLNNCVVKPVNVQTGGSQLPLRGLELLPDNEYQNFALIAKRRSGKTQVLMTLLKACVLPSGASRRSPPSTTVVFFVSTLHSDPAYKHLMKWLDRKGISHVDYTSIREGASNHLEEFRMALEERDKVKHSQQGKEAKSGAGKDILHTLMFGRGEGTPRAGRAEEEEEEGAEQENTKYKPLDFIIVLDDLGGSLRNTAVESWLKVSRHFLAHTILSSQYDTDLSLASWLQLNVICVFKGQTLEKLEKIYKLADLSVDFVQFVRLYDEATDKAFSFLYVAIRTGQFRKNFNIELTAI